MALNYALRTVAAKFVPSASRFVPLAATASAGVHRYLHHHQTSAVFAVAGVNNLLDLFQRTSPSLIRRYSSKPSSDESLLRVIESEIQCAEESQDPDQVEEAPQDFPYKIEDHPGEQTITLTRKYTRANNKVEDITVEVHMPDLTAAEENEDDDKGEEEMKESGSQPSIPLVVRVSVKDEPFLEFGCTAYPDEIIIDTLSIKDPTGSEDQMAYEGPDFADLDENLQKAFHKFLEVRGIKPSTTNFLHGYMLEKDDREYITWLKNLHKFVEA
ncbi:uncharacterized protein At2g39795, mitochondrial-like [Andrographis paniculata]|uniref:uncharacterized protein At2g39795, mitochondrial-like n=1 Tax=Andrographis paniculata TaxID=175694 RepID=UPI0021E7D551|nr:uncharacterized protein At2g39795, mitochondrial-like [Andrographis paniculata]